MKIIKEVKEFETHHKVIFFLIVMLLTILITRFIVYYITDPDPKILEFELHHFDYGIVLLIVTVLFMLFVGKYEKIYLALTAISLGLVIDELWFIRKQIGGNNPIIYDSSFSYVILMTVLISMIAFLISSLFKKKK
ncbi:MAG: hypothetical protein ABH840_04040 [Nanoarchaeota archaeon]